MIISVVVKLIFIPWAGWRPVGSSGQQWAVLGQVRVLAGPGPGAQSAAHHRPSAHRLRASHWSRRWLPGR